MRIALLMMMVIESGIGHSCDHEKIKLKPKVVADIKGEHSERFLQTWRNMRITVDYQNLNSKFPSTNQFSSMIQYIIMNQIVDFIQTNVKVTGPTSFAPIEDGACSTYVKIPTNATSANIDTDLLIFVTAENDSTQSYVAQATACTISETTNRPTTGMINFNFGNMDTSSNNIDKNFRVALHEVMHILFFSPALYEFYVGYSQNNLPYTSSGGVYTMRTPKIIDFAKTQLGCSTASGVPLEDNGSVGSLGAHFERTWVGNELMSAQENIQMVISGYTAAMMVDSGWYQLGTGFSEYLSWGYQKGCTFVSSSFISSRCTSSSFLEYCSTASARSISCTSDYLSVSYCEQNTFTNTCVVALPSQTGYCSKNLSSNFVLSSTLEKKGANSRCIPVSATTNSGTSNAAGCFPVTCSGSTVVITVGSSSYTCTSANQKLVVSSSVTIVCPDPTVFCGEYTRASCNGSDCNGVGSCKTDGTCRCRFGYTGNTCANKLTTCTIPNDSLCNTYFSADSTTNVGLFFTFLAIFSFLL